MSKVKHELASAHIATFAVSYHMYCDHCFDLLIKILEPKINIHTAFFLASLLFNCVLLNTKCAICCASAQQHHCNSLGDTFKVLHCMHLYAMNCGLITIWTNWLNALQIWHGHVVECRYFIILTHPEHQPETAQHNLQYTSLHTCTLLYQFSSWLANLIYMISLNRL